MSEQLLNPALPSYGPLCHLQHLHYYLGILHDSTLKAFTLIIRMPLSLLHYRQQTLFRQLCRRAEVDHKETKVHGRIYLQYKHGLFIQNRIKLLYCIQYEVGVLPVLQQVIAVTLEIFIFFLQNSYDQRGTRKCETK